MELLKGLFSSKKNRDLRYPQFPAKHISNVQVGDKINTPSGIETVYWCNEYRFTTYKCDEKGKVVNQGLYGYVPYFEGGNSTIFSIVR